MDKYDIDQVNLAMDIAFRHGESWGISRQQAGMDELSIKDLICADSERYKSMRNEVSEKIGQFKKFPMQDGPDIPWSLAEEIYLVYSELYGTDQTLERLAERGGFGWAEIPIFMEQKKKRGRK